MSQLAMLSLLLKTPKLPGLWDKGCPSCENPAKVKWLQPQHGKRLKLCHWKLAAWACNWDSSNVLKCLNQKASCEWDILCSVVQG